MRDTLISTKHFNLYRQDNGLEAAYYPNCCLSGSCGKVRSECGDCRNLPHLTAFEKWVETKKAERPDEIWSPTRYVATVK